MRGSTEDTAAMVVFGGAQFPPVSGKEDLVLQRGSALRDLNLERPSSGSHLRSCLILLRSQALGDSSHTWAAKGVYKVTPSQQGSCG